MDAVTSTKLSSSDKNNLKIIYDALEKINIPTVFTNVGVIPRRHHSNRTGTFNQRNARQTSFGLTTYMGKRQDSVNTKKYPHILPLFKNFIDLHIPNFTFSTVYVNKNTVAKQHLDKKNSGESLLVGFYDYIGGETVLHNIGETGDKVKFNIQESSIIFDGSKIVHSSEPFTGTRYSLVFFK
jgi:hypothetical protein